jgi:hypothetical protein
MFAKSILSQATDAAFAETRTSRTSIAGKVLFAIAATLATGSIAMAAEGSYLGHQYGLQRDAAPQQIAGVPRLGPHATERLLYWNGVAIDASGLDHTPVAVGENRVFGEQVGPARSARAMAIIHIAMYDAVNAITKNYQPYAGSFSAPAHASVDAAIAQAAHDTLVVMYPSQKAAFDSKLTADLAQIVTKTPSQKTDGIALGKATAAAILALRTNDGSQVPDPTIGVGYNTGTTQADWKQDPVSQVPEAIGAYWGDVKPFAIKSRLQFRLPPPLALNSSAYAAVYNNTKTLGGDGLHTATTRNADQTQIGIFYAYDGVPTLCAPPRMYNQFANQIAEQQGIYNVSDLSRLLAMVNTSLADAALVAWDSKFYYHFQRPITGIRGASATTNPNTVPDTAWMPLGSQASNLTGPNFTPPFPGYPSGHGTFGGALFQTLRDFFGTDDIEFTLASDEYNGITRDNTGAIRPVALRTFNNFTEAEFENGYSRIYQGVHFTPDMEEGIKAGRKVADWVFKKAFKRTDLR